MIISKATSKWNNYITKRIFIQLKTVPCCPNEFVCVCISIDLLFLKLALYWRVNKKNVQQQSPHSKLPSMNQVKEGFLELQERLQLLFIKYKVLMISSSQELVPWCQITLLAQESCKDDRPDLKERNTHFNENRMNKMLYKILKGYVSVNLTGKY